MTKRTDTVRRLPTKTDWNCSFRIVAFVRSPWWTEFCLCRGATEAESCLESMFENYIIITANIWSASLAQQRSDLHHYHSKDLSCIIITAKIWSASLSQQRSDLHHYHSKDLSCIIITANICPATLSQQRSFMQHYHSKDLPCNISTAKICSTTT